MGTLEDMQLTEKNTKFESQPTLSAKFLPLLVLLALLGTVLCSCWKTEAEEYREKAEMSSKRIQNLKRQYDVKWTELNELRRVLGYSEQFEEADKQERKSSAEAVEGDEEDLGEEEESEDIYAAVIANELDRIDSDVLLKKTPTAPLTVESIMRELEYALNKARLERQEARIERDTFKQRWKDEEEAKREQLREQAQAFGDMTKRFRLSEKQRKELQEKLDKYISKHGKLD
jgi:hypothetical protein